MDLSQKLWNIKQGAFGEGKMIKFEKTCVLNMENAMRGARNPLESWARSDSYYDADGAYVLGEKL